MGSFDIAVGMSAGELNSASQQVYTALYPKVFTGSGSPQYEGVTYTVKWNVPSAPQFDLSTSGGDLSTLTSVFNDRLAAEGWVDVSPQVVSVLEVVAASVPTFSVAFDNVVLSFSTGSLQPTELSLTLTASCYLEISGNTLELSPYQVTAPTQSDPVTDYIVQNVLVPDILQAAQHLLSGITIPPITVAGLSLSVPAAGIVDDCLIATLNLSSSGTPPPPDDTTSWPSDPFFAMVGPHVVEALTINALASATNKFSDSGKGGDFAGGYSWSYGLRLANPSTSIDDSQIAMSFDLSGSVSAGVHVTWLKIDIGYDAYAAPQTSLVADVVVNGASLEIITDRVNPFTVLITPDSHVPSWVFGSLLVAIADAVVGSLTPLIAQFLGGIRIQSLQLPRYSVDVSGTTLTLTPSNLEVGNVDGYLAVVGNVEITS